MHFYRVGDGLRELPLVLERPREHGLRVALLRIRAAGGEHQALARVERAAGRVAFAQEEPTPATLTAFLGVFRAF